MRRDEATAAHDTAQAKRLARIILMEERKERTRAAKQENQDRTKTDSFFSPSTPRPAGLAAAKQPPLAYFNRFEDELKQEEAEREARLARQAREQAFREESARREEARRRAEDFKRQEREQYERRRRDRERRQQQESKDRYEQQGRKEKKKKSKRSRDAKPHYTAPPPQPVVTVVQITQWYDFAKSCEKNWDKVQTFPSPPGGCCGRTSCVAASVNRALQACDCSVRRAFELVEVRGAKEAKKEMLKWHSDHWAKSPEDKRESFRKMADEIFVVLGAVVRGDRVR